MVDTKKNKAQALYDFYSSFGLQAYEETVLFSSGFVPTFPYITYQLVTDSFSENGLPVTMQLYYAGSSLKDINAKTEEISERIGDGGEMLKCTDGYIWIKRGSPFAQTAEEPNNDRIRRKIINLNITFFTSK